MSSPNYLLFIFSHLNSFFSCNSLVWMCLKDRLYGSSTFWTSLFPQIIFSLMTSNFYKKIKNQMHFNDFKWFIHTYIIKTIYDNLNYFPLQISHQNIYKWVLMRIFVTDFHLEYILLNNVKLIPIEQFF